MSKLPSSWKFKLMRDQMPAIAFAGEFSKAFEKECERQHGDIIPNDRHELFRIAQQVLIQMGEPPAL